MGQEMEENINRQKEYAQTIDRKFAKNEIKRKLLIESQRQLKEDLSDDEEMMNKDLMEVDSENSNGGNSDPEPEPLLELMDGKDNESEGHSSEDEKKVAFVNPLAKKVSKKQKVDGEISEGEWSDESEGNGKKKNKAADKKILGKRKRGQTGEDSDEDAAKDFFGGDAIEVVP
jgi:hypothetical protein